MSDEPTRFMIDIETMGTRPGCAVTAVGILWFDPLSDEPVRGAEFAVDDPTGAEDPSTVEWWAQPERAEAKAYLEALEVVPAHRVTARIVSYMASKPLVGSRTEWWAKSPNFDMSILESLAERTNTRVPWKFWELRDVRTAYGMVGADFPWRNFTPDAPLHSPLADCQLQAKDVSQILRATRGLGRCS